jgi:hypothetical protein
MIGNRGRFRSPLKKFAKDCLVAIGVGGITFGLGTLLHVHAHSEQKRLWRSSEFSISRDLAKSQFVDFNFIAEDDNRYFLDLCIGAQSQKRNGDTGSLSSIPLMSWKILSGGETINSGDGSEGSLHLVQDQRTCRNLGRFSGNARQVYQIRIQADQINVLPFRVNPYVQVRPDARLTQNRLIPLYLIAVTIQFFGIYAFVHKVVKGIIMFTKSLRSPAEKTS